MNQRHLPGQPHQLPRHNTPMAGYQPEHFLLSVKDGVATVSLNRPERKNPLTFDSYAELRDLFQQLRHASDVKVVTSSVPFAVSSTPESRSSIGPS